MLAAAWALVRSREATGRDPVVPPPASGAISIAIAALALAAVAVYELARLRLLIGRPLTDIDMLAFHLPGVARWIQTGTLWRVDQFLPGFETGQYPNNGDFLILSTVLPWHDLAFARLPAVLFFVLTGIGVYALSLELGASRAAAATFAAVALVVPTLSGLALDGMPDDITLSMLALGAVFLIRHARTRRTGELLLGGLALGLSLGTKWFGLTAAVVVVVVWAASWLLRRSPLPRIARDGGGLLAMMALGGGVWLVRNIVESGNPIYPKTVSIFGWQLFAGSHNDVVDRYGYTIADYLGKPTILRKYIYPAFKVEVGIAGLVLVVGLVVAIAWSLAALRRASPRDRAAAMVLAVAVATVGICATYVITPGSAYGTKGSPVETAANVRWLMPAVVLGAAVCASAVGRLRRWGVVLELAGLAAVADGIKLGPGVVTGTAVRIAFALAAIVAAGVVGRRWAAAGRTPISRGALLAATAAAVVLVVALGRADQRTFDRQSYAAYDPVFAWIDAHASSGHRIGVTGGTGENGLSAVLPVFGPRLGNRVTYVGDVVRHSVAVPSREPAFRAELRRGRYDLLVIGLKYAGQTDAWARAFGYRLVAHSDRLVLYAAPQRSLA
jgi:hypothetical protein